MLETLIYYMGFPLIRYAVAVVVLIALCSSLIGVTLVLKRFSFIGDGLSHVAFGAVAVATVLNVSTSMIVVLPITVICAILLLKGGKYVKVKGDAAIAMISVSALAVGYLLMNISSKSANLSGDVCSTLFGSTALLSLELTDVLICLAISILVTVAFVIFYNRIFAVTFDEDFSRTCGVNAEKYNLMIAIIIAVIIVLAMKFVGSLLISALIVFPALSAMRIFKSFFKVTVCSAVISVVCALSGVIVSILAGTPVGSTIVAANIICYFCFVAAGRIKGE